MSDPSGNPSSNQGISWLRISAEGVAIVVSILLAFGIQAWWEARSDRDLEQHLLGGIRADLALDVLDINSAMSVARARVAGADELLTLLSDADAGWIRPTPWVARTDAADPGELDRTQWLAEARTHYAVGSMSAQQALHMVSASGSIQSVDISDATFNEATASGQLHVIRDPDLRAAIAEYYFQAGRFGGTTDNRVESHMASFRGALADAGIPFTGSASDASVMGALQENANLLAELKNAREMATAQLVFHARVMTAAERVIGRLDSQ